VPEQQTKLDRDAILLLLQKDSPFAQSMPGFELREQQQKMMANVLDAYQSKQIALIEAGTGTGKSMAYLIPALLWASQFQERTVISTHTINLQEQLIHKDLPLIMKALNLDLQTCLVKGMHNYVCWRKLKDSLDEIPLLSAPEASELKRIETWTNGTRDGTISDLPFMPSPNAWDKVRAEHDMCNRGKCPFFKQCFFFKARR
jgi:ATP-dependent DNA helicase DinG